MKWVKDPDGVPWEVCRKWFNAMYFATGTQAFNGTPIDTILMFITLPLWVAWPFWLAAKWLGVPWTIVVKRSGKEVGREKMRRWRESGKRIDEFARLVQLGMYSGAD